MFEGDGESPTENGEEHKTDSESKKQLPLAACRFLPGLFRDIIQFNTDKDKDEVKITGVDKTRLEDYEKSLHIYKNKDTDTNECLLISPKGKKWEHRGKNDKEWVLVLKSLTTP